MRNVYNISLRQSLFARLLVMYKVSNFNHKATMVSSFANSRRTSLDKQSWIVDNAFSSKSSHWSSVMEAGFFDFPSKAFFNLLWIRTALIWTRQIEKLILPSNFSMSNLDILKFSIE
ncbi:hypothetical protein Lalb_Chr04g0254481 [Lupinus albus]|uniref:Uncharacterized protein n=1 Tax=Lupinus albus TaxID=3870 RepID=A0A6A4QPD2_LUPAL|nr:hypothetical protein Lalb_Chr04g0254481 [Lupinus albus]